jgi:uncharacterized membrane protein
MRVNLLNKLVLFCISLVVIRFFKTGHYSFLFLIWNLFLAWLPLFFIRRSATTSAKHTGKLLLLASILFLPNAPYLVTDLFHLKKELVAPLWFDVVMITSFAMAGLIYFLMAFEMILAGIKDHFGKFSAFAKPLLLAAMGYGIYLGRYLRYNSWDVFVQPVHLAADMLNSVFNPDKFINTACITITFAVFLYLIFEIYLSFKNKAVTQNELR